MNPKPQHLRQPPVAYRAMQFLMWPLLKVLGMSCQDIHELSAERLDRTLTRREEMQLRVHTFMCGLCRRLPSQFRKLRELVRCAHVHEETNGDVPQLSAEATERIAAELRKKPDTSA